MSACYSSDDRNLWWRAGSCGDHRKRASASDTRVVELSNARIEQQLKISLPAETIQQMLEALGFDVEVRDVGFRCKAPSWRFDVSIEQDLIEEIARIYGYNKLPTSLPAQAHDGICARGRDTTDAIEKLSVDQGIQEAITYSFVDPEELQSGSW